MLNGMRWTSLKQYQNNSFGFIANLYRQISNITRTNYQHLKDSRTVLWLSLPNPLKPDAKSRTKM